jgi:hypothetical protein
VAFSNKSPPVEVSSTFGCDRYCYLTREDIVRFLINYLIALMSLPMQSLSSPTCPCTDCGGATTWPPWMPWWRSRRLASPLASTGTGRQPRRTRTTMCKGRRRTMGLTSPRRHRGSMAGWSGTRRASPARWWRVTEGTRLWRAGPRDLGAIAEGREPAMNTNDEHKWRTMMNMNKNKLMIRFDMVYWILNLILIIRLPSYSITKTPLYFYTTP